MKPSRSWSLRLRDRFGLRLDPSWIDWWDSELWMDTPAGEFHHPVSPDVLLAEHPDTIWPGLMLPDTLPVVGNRYGDWLCLRVGADDAVVEVIHWYHGGGDWIPWGRNIAEALYFDSVRGILPGRRQLHALRPEPSAPQPLGADSIADQKVANWLKRWLPSDLTETNTQTGGNEIAARMLAHQVCKSAVLCEQALDALDGTVRRKFSPHLATECGVDWEPTGLSWLFDDRLMEPRVRERINDEAADPGSRKFVSQDWERAAAEAMRVIEKRNDLSWPFDIAGWAMEQRERFDQAGSLYQRGMFAFAFADQSVRFRTHWFPHWAGKFSTWRLSELVEQGRVGVDQLEPRAAEYLRIILSDRQSLPSERASRYWRTQAGDAETDGRWADAYNAYYRAGWDLGVERMSDYRELLEGLVNAAEKSHQTARSLIAKTHLDCFNSRFGTSSPVEP